ncbi:MAG: ComEC/Rec2 family competence protein [Verrucomicrobiota bacterium]
MKIRLGWLKAGWKALSACGRQMREPLFSVALAGVTGILLADWRGGVFSWAVVAGVMVLMTVLRRGRWWVYAAALTVFGLMHTLWMRDPLREAVAEHLHAGSAAAARVTGVVVDAPVESAGGKSWSFPLEVEALTVGNGNWPGRGARLYARVTETLSPPVYGDRVELSGVIIRPEETRNPGEFDFAAFLLRNGYAAQFSGGGGPGECRVLAQGQGNPVMAAALRSRDWIGKAVTEGLEDSPDIAATVRTMVLGTREKTPQEIEDAFRASGTMHIFAVSGLHIALFAMLLTFTLSRTPLPRGWIVVLSLGLMVFYVFVTGLRPSAWRAAIMMALVLMGPWWHRESNLFNSLAAAALLLLGWDTRQLFQPGFVLSFGVLLAIALFQKSMARGAGFLLGRSNAPDPFLPEELWSRRQRGWYWSRKWLCESLGLSFASTVGTMPLMLGYFNMITPIGIVANLFLVTLSAWILAVACISLLSTAAGLPGLAVIWNNTNWALAWCSIGLAKFFAALPGGHVRIDPARLWRGSPCEITVLALEHGGGGIRIDTPAGRQWLVDCGGLKHWNGTLRPHLERAPVNVLDGVILTHADTYHTGALAPLTALFHPRQIWRGEENVKSPGTPLTLGRTLVLDDKTTLEVLFPPASWQAPVADDHALVLRLECRGWRVLMMSDAGFVTEKALLASGMDLRADVLVKGRHGSDFSGLPEFVNAVKPGALIYTNCRFPEAERAPDSWRDRLAAKGIVMLDQARAGGVTVSMDEGGIRVRSYLGGLEWVSPAGPAPVWSAPVEKPGPLIR